MLTKSHFYLLGRPGADPRVEEDCGSIRVSVPDDKGDVVSLILEPRAAEIVAAGISRALALEARRDGLSIELGTIDEALAELLSTQDQDQRGNA